MYEHLKIFSLVFAICFNENSAHCASEFNIDLEYTQISDCSFRSQLIGSRNFKYRENK
jgi:hypothetical protein